MLASLAISLGVVIAAQTINGGAPVATQPADPVRWHGVLAAGHSVEVIGVLGSVRAVPATGREVVVEARQIVRDPEDSVSFSVVQHDGNVTICAMYPLRGTPHDPTDDERRHARVPDDWEGGPQTCE